MKAPQLLSSFLQVAVVVCTCLAAGVREGHAASATGLNGRISLTTVGGTTAGAVLPGENSPDNTGIAVSSAGDVNDDGLDDFLIGAYLAPSLAARGKTFLVYGQSGPNELGGTVPLSTVGFTTAGTEFLGSRPNLYSGVSTSTAGDFNGDGIDDLLIGTTDSESYLIYGQSSAMPGAVSLGAVGTTRPGVTFRVNNSLYSSSHVVSNAGDVNGDGLSDILIGTGFTERSGNSFVGRAYLIYGQTGGLPAGTIDLANVGSSIPGALFTGAQLGDEFGNSVSAAGDVNGDGLGDFLIGAYQNFVSEEKPGEAYLVYGKSGPQSLSGTINASAIGNTTTGAVFTGMHLNGGLGFALSGGGDFNGDGFSDILLAANAVNWETPGPSTGEAYVVFGKGAPGPLSGQFNVQQLGGAVQGLRIPSADGMYLLGNDVSAPGDFNGDGFDDIVLSSPYSERSGHVNAGETVVIYGRSNLSQASALDLNLLGTSTLPGVTFEGNANIRVVGYSASWAGDVNGDGVTDLIIGAPGGGDNGSGYLIYGVRTIPEPSTIMLLITGGMLLSYRLSPRLLTTGSPTSRERESLLTSRSPTCQSLRLC